MLKTELNANILDMVCCNDPGTSLLKYLTFDLLLGQKVITAS